MAQIPDRFVDVVQQLKENKQPKRVTVRNLLKLFNAERRGAKVAAEIEDALQQAGLTTEPPFAQADINGLLRFVLRSGAALTPAGSATRNSENLRPTKAGDYVFPAAAVKPEAVEHESDGYAPPAAIEGPLVLSQPKYQDTSGLPTESNDQPIIGGQTTAQNEAVETVLKRLEEGEIFVPSYQRDSDEWDNSKKSLFIESILNRLTVPAFYLAPAMDDPDRFEVVDGQQRLNTLALFFRRDYRLAADSDCPYFGASMQYAGHTYDEIHESWQKAFRRYNLTLVTLPQNMPLNLRLEVFRRINQGGTPLSGQDIRLSYYSESPAVRYIQVVGIYDKDRIGATRMLANSSAGYDWPWAANQDAAGAWKRWWINTATVTGQTSSEMFLWYIVAKTRAALDNVLANKTHLSKSLGGLLFRNSTEEVLDIVCAQLKFEDQSPSTPRVLPDAAKLAKEYFPEFQT
jgi:hypothetical protein